MDTLHLGCQVVVVEARVRRAKSLWLVKADGERGRLRTTHDVIRGHRTGERLALSVPPTWRGC